MEITMTQIKQIYRCKVCGNIVEVINTGAGTLVCCGQDMELLSENTVEASLEKHVPVIEKTEKGIKVKVGSIPHPMEDSHYIQWIECLECGCRKFLKPGDAPEAEFCCSECGGQAREYCNLHGLWKSN